MIKRLDRAFISFILCAALMLTGAGAASSEDIRSGSLTIELLEDHNGAKRGIEGIHVSLFRVADVEPLQNDGMIRFVPAGSLAGANDGKHIELEIAVGPEGDFAELAVRFYDYAVSNHIGPMVNARPTDANGRVVFGELHSGLYLVAQANTTSATHIMAPTLVPVYWYTDNAGGDSGVIAKPKTETRPPEPPIITRPPTTRPTRPPTTTTPPTEGNLVPDENRHIEFDSDGTPLGEWTYDDEEGTWVYEEFDDDELLFEEETPLGDLPQTGVLRWPIPFLCALGGVTMTSGLFVLTKGKKKNES